MKTVEVPGVWLQVLDRGRGVPVVFVHGAVADYRVWESQVKAFETDYRVVTYSLRHHFPSSPNEPIPSYDTGLHAADLATLLRSLDAFPAHLVGHSYGGRVAALVAIQHPELVRSLVLAEPSIFSFLSPDRAAQAALAAHDNLVEHVLGLTPRGGPEAAAAFIDAMAAPRDFLRFPERLRGIVLANAHTLRPLLLARLKEPADLFHDLRQIHLPVLLVEGELSPRLYKLAVAAIRSALPQASHEVMRGVAHGLHIEAPRYFSDLLRRFIAGH